MDRVDGGSSGRCPLSTNSLEPASVRIHYKINWARLRSDLGQIKGPMQFNLCSPNNDLGIALTLQTGITESANFDKELAATQRAANLDFKAVEDPL